ncbi:MAG TPA: hypothetical protein ENK18_19385, partial [Deltaproteobacteria bacterium]|nr:hypothetical protein [Deltaproteobacteria bacterium]
MNQRMFVALGGAATLLSALVAWGISAGLARAVALRPDAVTSLGERSSAPDPLGTPGGRPPTQRTRILSSDAYLDGIMRRNLFDVEIIATWAPEPEDDADQEMISELEVELIGTAVTEPLSLSSAVIRHTEDELVRGYSLGDKLFDREIVSIEPRRVTLRRPDGGLEILQIEGESIERA